MDKIFFKSLKVNSLVSPIGIDNKKPFFSWVADSDGHDKKQTAYRVEVSCDADFGGLMWDSGEVLSDKVSYVEYDGKPLASTSKYFWRPR